MHQLLVRAIVTSARVRLAQGNCPTEKQFTPEQLEHAIIALDDELTKLQGVARHVAELARSEGEVPEILLRELEEATQ